MFDFGLLVEQSLKILRKADEKFSRIGLSWSSGKDSTLCLYLFQKIQKDFPVIFTDTYVHFPETIKFRDYLTKKWNLNLYIARAPFNKVEELIEEREKCCHYHKTKPFLNVIKNLGLDAVIVGIRWDEHESRSNEKYFSEREGHSRIHPILHWNWEAVMEFLKMRLPMNPLYKKEFTSVGCRTCTKPNPEGEVERGGRSQDKEEIMRRLRNLGYF